MYDSQVANKFHKEQNLVSTFLNIADKFNKLPAIFSFITTAFIIAIVFTSVSLQSLAITDLEAAKKDMDLAKTQLNIQNANLQSLNAELATLQTSVNACNDINVKSTMVSSAISALAVHQAKPVPENPIEKSAYDNLTLSLEQDVASAKSALVAANNKCPNPGAANTNYLNKQKDVASAGALATSANTNFIAKEAVYNKLLKAAPKKDVATDTIVKTPEEIKAIAIELDKKKEETASSLKLKEEEEKVKELLKKEEDEALAKKYKDNAKVNTNVATNVISATSSSKNVPKGSSGFVMWLGIAILVVLLLLGLMGYIINKQTGIITKSFVFLIAKLPKGKKVVTVENAPQLPQPTTQVLAAQGKQANKKGQKIKMN
jgi:hypothetical protein